ncbi:hypothetical protein ACSBR2_041701 [Camellia fascicularis]
MDLGLIEDLGCCLLKLKIEVNSTTQPKERSLDLWSQTFAGGSLFAGHKMPLWDLTNQLAIHGLTIIILVTPKNLSILNPLLSKHPSIKTLVLPFPVHPSLPTGAENVKDLPPIAFPAIMLSITHYVEGDPILEFLKDGVLVMASSGLVFNWFSELERVYFDHVMEEAGHDRVWAVDPLQPTEDDSPAKRSGSRPELASDISPWLDTCEDRTVVYMCFGSQAVLNNNLIEEITSGLEKNRAKFLWCVKEAQRDTWREITA